MKNSQLAQIEMRVNPQLDDIHMDGKRINCQNFSTKIILINKPKFVINICYENYI